MKHLVQITVLALLLSGCEASPEQSIEEVAPNSSQVEALLPATPVPPVIVSRDNAVNMTGYDQSLADYSGVELGDTVNDVYNKTRAYLFGDNADYSRDDMTYREHAFENPTVLVNVYGVDNMKDDSVKAIELKTVFNHDGANMLSLVTYGARQKCWRAEDKEAWTTNLCP